MEIILTALCVCLVVLNYVGFRSLLRSFQHERASWAVERVELLNRIQAPERITIPQGQRQAVPHVVPEDEGELAKVGQIVWGEADE